MKMLRCYIAVFYLIYATVRWGKLGDGIVTCDVSCSDVWRMLYGGKRVLVYGSRMRFNYVDVYYVSIVNK